jgi:hypothetical protein
LLAQISFLVFSFSRKFLKSHTFAYFRILVPSHTFAYFRVLYFMAIVVVGACAALLHGAPVDGGRRRRGDGLRVFMASLWWLGPGPGRPGLGLADWLMGPHLVMAGGPWTHDGEIHMVNDSLIHFIVTYSHHLFIII